MQWWQDLTGLTSEARDEIEGALGVEGSWLVSGANGRRMQIGKLSVPTLAELRRGLSADSGRAHLREEERDWKGLYLDPENAGAIFQVSAPFNLLSPAQTGAPPEAGMADLGRSDHPAAVAAMACGAGAVWRHYLLPLGEQAGQSSQVQIDCAHDLGVALGNTDDALWDMHNGVLLPHPAAMAQINAEIASRAPVLRDLMRIGVQQDTEVTLPSGGHLVTQALCPVLDFSQISGTDQDYTPFARLLLEAAYEATFALAARMVARRGSARLYLTRLGAGEMGNDPEVISGAIRSAVRRVPMTGIEVVMVHDTTLTPENQALLRG